MEASQEVASEKAGESRGGALRELQEWCNLYIEGERNDVGDLGGIPAIAACNRAKVEGGRHGGRSEVYASAPRPCAIDREAH
jgi:hypothetical protein